MNEINTELTEEQKEKIDNELVYCPRNPSFDEIIDNIYVGNYAFALNKKMLIDNKIAHILNCGNGLMNFYEKENIFKYLYLPLYDSPNEKIEKHLEKSNKFIKEGSENGNKVLVHCGCGVSRSVTVTYMYMIMEKGYTFSKAKEIMSNKRKCAYPNEGFVKQLMAKSMELHHEI